MFEAALVGDERGSGFGTFKFEHLPSPGDRIVIGNVIGSLDILRVRWIEHHPVKVPTSPVARPDPTVVICVELIASDEG